MRNNARNGVKVFSIQPVLFALARWVEKQFASIYFFWMQFVLIQVKKIKGVYYQVPNPYIKLFPHSYTILKKHISFVCVELKWFYQTCKKHCYVYYTHILFALQLQPFSQLIISHTYFKQNQYSINFILNFFLSFGQKKDHSQVFSPKQILPIPCLEGICLALSALAARWEKNA